MNKGEFLKAVAEKAKITQKLSDEVYEAMIDTISAELKNGGKVTLLGFGTFEVKKKAAREGINPKTKQKIKIPASKVPAFKMSRTFKDIFN